MHKNRLPALALAGALTLTLAACGDKPTETPTPTPIDTPAVSESAQPSAAPSESVEPSVEPTETAEAEPVESDTPSIATPKPTDAVQVSPIETAPASTPAPTPEPTPAPAASLTAADVYAKVSASAGGSAMSDMSFVLEDYYNVSASDLEDYALYQPDMSASIEEIFIAKAAGGKVDSVKAACQSRLEGLKEDAEFYPATGAYVDSARVETNGDWVLFCVCENADAAVKAFNDALK